MPEDPGARLPAGQFRVKAEGMPVSRMQFRIPRLPKQDQRGASKILAFVLEAHAKIHPGGMLQRFRSQQLVYKQVLLDYQQAQKAIRGSLSVGKKASHARG
jgi:hypothetical protein